MMKLSEWITRIGLILMVILSIYFSVNIWLNSAKKIPEMKSGSQVTTAVNEKAIGDVYLPLQLIRIADGKAMQSNRETLISNVQNDIKMATFGKLTQVVTKNAEQLKRYNQMEQGIELLYQGPFLISDYASIYNLSINFTNFNELTDQYFTKIQLDFNENKIRFLDYDQANVYEAPMTVNKARLMGIINKEGLQYQDVSENTLTKQGQYYLTNDMKLKKYSYILASQPVTRFRNAFFNETEDIQTNEDSQDLTYTSKEERLFAEEKLGKIDFKGTLPEENKRDSIYNQSFSYVKRLGTNMGNLRYFDRTKDSVNYRTFMEGFPVFSNDLKGQVDIRITNNDGAAPSVTINTSVNTIQVPIPSEEEVTLESTEKLIKRLETAGAKKEKIQSAVIGYTWQTIEEVKQVVDLSPEWYVLYNNNWYTATDLVKQLPSLEVG